jgi:hypothetical protein
VTIQLKQDRPAAATRPSLGDGADRPGDVLVAFGITGDLAKQMTLRSLYRLDRRGLLDTPVVGVAVDDWTTDRLRQHAHDVIAASGESIDEAVFKRFAAGLEYLRGDFTNPDTYRRLDSVISGAQTPVYYLEIPPSLFDRVRGAARSGHPVPAGGGSRRAAPDRRGTEQPDGPAPDLRPALTSRCRRRRRSETISRPRRRRRPRASRARPR